MWNPYKNAVNLILYNFLLSAVQENIGLVKNFDFRYSKLSYVLGDPEEDLTIFLENGCPWSCASAPLCVCVTQILFAL